MVPKYFHSKRYNFIHIPQTVSPLASPFPPDSDDETSTPSSQEEIREGNLRPNPLLAAVIRQQTEPKVPTQRTD